MVTPDDAQTVVTHLELLKKAYQRQGGWDKDVHIYKELFHQLSSTFHQEKTWTGVQDIEKWSSKIAAGDTTGTFVAPTSWEFTSIGEAEKKHSNLLRRRSEDWRRLVMKAQEHGQGQGNHSSVDIGVTQNGGGAGLNGQARSVSAGASTGGKHHVDGGGKNRVGIEEKEMMGGGGGKKEVVMV